MPIVAILLGVICLDLAFRGTEHAFGAQLASDFGGGEFVSWGAAILILGGLGYVPKLQKLSSLSLALVLVGLVLRNGGLFTQLAKIIENPPSAAAAVPLSSFGGSGSSGNSGGGLFGSIGSAVSDFGDIGGGGDGGSGGEIQTASAAAEFAAA